LKRLENFSSSLPSRCIVNRSVGLARSDPRLRPRHQPRPDHSVGHGPELRERVEADQEIGSPNVFALIEAMSRAELIAFITQSIEAGELQWGPHKPDSDQPVALLADK
jgi:hypothetical protein